jgi:hypothetical protein
MDEENGQNGPTGRDLLPRERLVQGTNFVHRRFEVPKRRYSPGKPVMKSKQL